MDDPTLSGRVEVARVCRVAVAVLALAFGAMFIVMGGTSDQIFLGVICIGIAVAVLLIGALGHIPFPEILPHTERFGVLLPSVLGSLTGIAGTVGAAGVWFILTEPKVSGIAHQTGVPADLWMEAFVLILWSWVWMPVLGGGWLMVALARSAPWRVRGEGAGNLRVWFVYRYYTFNPAELRVWRVEAGPVGRVVALHLSDGRRTVILPAGSAASRQGEFLVQLDEWLSERGAEVVAGRPIAAGPAWWAWVRQGMLVVSGLACIFLPWGVVWAGYFWGEWFREGTWSAMFFIKTLPWCLLASVLCLASPLYGWLGRLFGGLWLEGKPPEGWWRVTVIEGMSENKFSPSSTRSGLLGAEGEALRLVVGKKEYTIPRDAILELEPMGLIRKIFDDAGEPFYRFLARPICLAWRAEEDGRPVVHAVLLAARGGVTNGRERRLDRVLWQRLAAWRQGGTPVDFSTPKPATARPGALVATLFLVIGFIVPPVHNHLIRTRIATGAWPPPTRPLPASVIQSNIHDMEAASPDGMMMFYDPAAGNAKGVPSNTIVYWGNPSEGIIRPVRTGSHLLLFDAVFSFPGRATHAYISPDWYLSLVVIPPHFRDLSADSMMTHQVVDLRTGRGRSIHALDGVAYLSPMNLALSTGGDRLFYASPNTIINSPVTAEFGWVDVARDLRHPVGVFSYPRDLKQKPAFFPGGRYILFQWNVLDLETGQVRPVIPQLGANWAIDNTYPGICALGPRLVGKVHVFPNSNPVAAQPNSAAGGAAAIDPVTGMPLDPNADVSNASGIDPITGMPLVPSVVSSTPSLPLSPRDEYWEIDPVTARRRVITLSPGTSLLSADEGRWLVVERAPEPPAGKAETEAEKMKRFAIPREFSLFSPTTGRVRALFRERREGRYFLVQGRDEILVCSEKNVWSRRALAADKGAGGPAADSTTTNATAH